MASVSEDNHKHHRKILVVDDEEDLRKSLGVMLQKEGYTVETVGSAPEAQAVIGAQKFDLVITDIRMPKMTGIELLQWGASTHPKLRFVVMTGFADLKQMVDTNASNCRNLLMKPFTTQSMVTVVRNALIQAEVVNFDPSKYASITISEFISPPTLACALYIKSVEGKFIRIASPGDVVPRENLLSLREKSINELWLEIDQFNDYKNSQLKISNAAAKSKSIPFDVKVKMLKAATELAAENVRVMGATNETLQESVGILENSLDTLLEQESTSEIVKVMENQNRTIYGHSVSCSLIAASLTKVLGWTSKKNINILVTGAFLHDVGLYKLPPELQMKPVSQLSPEEREQYQKHCELGVETLVQAKSVPEEVLQITLSHHEHPNGSGYPKKLLKTDIYPLARTVGFIDAFVEAWGELSDKDRGKKGAVEELIKKIMVYDPMAFERRDSYAVQLALTEPSLVKARAKYLKEVGG